jgi:hypothetical protein
MRIFSRSGDGLRTRTYLLLPHLFSLIYYPLPGGERALKPSIDLQGKTMPSIPSTAIAVLQLKRVGAARSAPTPSLVVLPSTSKLDEREDRAIAQALTTIEKG